MEQAQDIPDATVLLLQVGQRDWEGYYAALHAAVDGLPASALVVKLDAFDVLLADCRRDLVAAFRAHNADLLSAVAGGCLIAPFASACECAMVQQQNDGGSLRATLRRILSTSSPGRRWNALRCSEMELITRCSFGMPKRVLC